MATVSKALRLDPVLHDPTRLQIASLLRREEELDFVTLRVLLGTTDGNLSTHLGALERAGFLRAEKRFILRKPRTTYQLTQQGRKAFVEYCRMVRGWLAENP